MVDISMCQNATCPSRMACFRYRAQPNPWRQSYANFEPDASGRCDRFAPIYPNTTFPLVPEAELK